MPVPLCYTHERLSLLLRFVVLFSTAITFTEASHPHGWSPAISLRDGSDEPDGNGWCPDIAGFGASLNCNGALQCHSCKPQGADTQFTYSSSTDSTGRITAFHYRGEDCADTNNGAVMGGCMTVSSGVVAAGAELTLDTCGENRADQNFVYTTSGYFRISATNDDAERDLCLGVGAQVNTAGPFWARDLILLECAEPTDPTLITWDVSPIPESIMDDSSNAATRTALPVPVGGTGPNPTASPVIAETPGPIASEPSLTDPPVAVATASPSLAPVITPPANEATSASSTQSARVLVGALLILGYL